VTIVGPSLDWRKDAFGHTQHAVNVAVDLLWSCIAPDGERSAIGDYQSDNNNPDA
jgi:hypothetical protein